MNIGRKIIFQLSTGNVLVDCGERNGSVVETTLDQDFQTYTALQGIQQNAVGVIKCDYGYMLSNFQTYPFHIDITKNPLDTTAIVWDINNPYGANLQQVQDSKIAQIQDLYNQALSAGFTSSASGSTVSYIYNDEAQKDFSDLFLLKANNALTYPVNVYSSTGETIALTEAQLSQLMVDIATFKIGLSNKKHNYLVQVQVATTIDEVNAIQIIF